LLEISVEDGGVETEGLCADVFVYDEGVLEAVVDDLAAREVRQRGRETVCVCV
jgi:hypothetical protein